MVTPEEIAVRDFIEHMLKYTVRLIRNTKDFPENFGLASGVIIERPSNPVLLTAGHIFNKPGAWTLETNIVVANMTLHLPLRDIQMLSQINLDKGTAQNIDLAWAQIHRADCMAALDSFPKTQEQRIELPLYCGPLDEEPKRNSFYGFAAWNKVELHQEVSTLVSEASYEIGMCYRGTCNGDILYEFELARDHQGYDYYQGTSGAPIADEEGRIIALVSGGDPAENLIFGVPLARYHSVLDLH